MRYALRNIIRLKLRSILCFMIIFAIFFLAMFGFLIRLLSEDNREHFYGPLDGSVHVTTEDLKPYLNYEAALTIAEDADVITKVSAVKEFTGMLCDLQYIGYDTMMRTIFSGEEAIEDRKTHYLKGFSVVAVTSMGILPEVYGGDLELVSGSMITDRDTADGKNMIVISEELAELNGLSLGDTITLNTASLYQNDLKMFRLIRGLNAGLFRDEALSDYEYTYVIGGIYRHLIDNSAAVTEPWNLNHNVVYVTMSSVLEISKAENLYQRFRMEDIHYNLANDPRLIPDALYFHLSDMAETDTLSHEINQIGFLKPIQLTEYVSDTASSPSARLSSIISYVLVGIIAVGFVILVLSVYFNMKARHRELAVLIALGKKRATVTRSFFFEIFVLIFLALMGSSALLAVVILTYAKPLLNYLYSAEISAQFRGEDADFYLLENTEHNMISQSMGSTQYLLSEYMIPSVIFALMATVLLAVILYIVMRGYTSRINPLYDVGGKE